MNLQEVDPPAQKCESESSSGKAGEPKHKDAGAIEHSSDLPDWNYEQNGRDWPDTYPKCGLPQ